MVRTEFVERKLHLIAEELVKLTRFKDDTYEELVGDEIRLAAAERILERIVLRAVDVNEHLLGALASGAEDKSTRLTYRETFQKRDYGLGASIGWMLVLLTTMITTIYFLLLFWRRKEKATAAAAEPALAVE